MTPRPHLWIALAVLGCSGAPETREAAPADQAPELAPESAPAAGPCSGALAPGHARCEVLASQVGVAETLSPEAAPPTACFPTRPMACACACGEPAIDEDECGYLDRIDTADGASGEPSIAVCERAPEVEPSDAERRVISAFEQARDEVCQCDNFACAEAAMERVTTLGDSLDDDQRQRLSSEVMPLVLAITECYQRIQDASP